MCGYLAVTLDSTVLMTIRHIRVNANGMGDGKAAWKSILDRFWSDEVSTVASIVSRLIRLKMSEGEGIQNFFIRAQESYSRLQQAGERSSATIFNALVITGLLENYQHFIVQESVNPSGDYTDHWKRLLNYSIGTVCKSCLHSFLPEWHASREAEKMVRE